MKRYLSLVLLTALAVLAGCTTAKMTVAPDGRSGVNIDCTGASSWGSCYQKAGEMCPRGYDILSKDGDAGNTVAAGTKDGFSSTQIATRAMLVACSN